jgi:hypothetical protein
MSRAPFFFRRVAATVRVPAVSVKSSGVAGKM